MKSRCVVVFSTSLRFQNLSLTMCCLNNRKLENCGSKYWKRKEFIFSIGSPRIYLKVKLCNWFNTPPSLEEFIHSNKQHTLLCYSTE